MLIVCPSCFTINRIPESKQYTDAKCGKCHGAMHTFQPATLSDQNFYRYIEKNELPVVVDFWADWCGPCQMMAPVFAKIASQSDSLLFAKLDTQANQQIASQAGIRSLPTLVLFYQGKEQQRISGALNEMQMKQWLVQTVQSL